jgi:flavoprotein
MPKGVTEREAIRKMFRKMFQDHPELMAKLVTMATRGQLPSSSSIPADALMVVIGGSWPSEIIGSMQTRCEGCKCFLSIAPSTQETIKNRTGKTIVRCMPCAAKTAVLENAVPEGPVQ